MQPELVQNSAGAGTGTNTQTGTFASTPIKGNTLVFTLYGNASSGQAWSTPAGWTKVQSLFTNIAVAMFYKTSAGNETTVASSNTGSPGSSSQLMEFTGSYILSKNGSAQNSSGTSITSSSFTPTATNQLLVMCGGEPGSQSGSSVLSSSAGATITMLVSSNGSTGWGKTNSIAAQTAKLQYNVTETANAIIAATFLQASVQRAMNNAIGNNSVGFPLANTTGNAIVVISSNRTGYGNLSVSDTNSNTYTAIETNVPYGANLAFFSIWIAYGIASGSNTISVAGTTFATPNVVSIWELSGIASSSAIDGIAFATQSSGTSPSSGSITTANAKDILLAQTTSSFTSNTITGGTNFINLLTDNDTVDYWSASEEQVVLVTGSYAGTFTFGTSAAANTILVAISTASEAFSESITQVAANIIATGGTQSVDISPNQVAATLTATGGTQSVVSIQDVSISQVGATLTIAGGTQSVATSNYVALTQVGANLTASGGTQSVATVNDVSITQVGANLTLTGGTQAVAAVQDISIAQVAATITLTGGTQAIATIQDVSVAQLAANLTITGGTQVVTSVNDVTISQTGATLTFTTGTQSVATVNNVAISQVAAALTFTGGTQVVSTHVITGTTNMVWLTDGTPVIRVASNQTKYIELLDGRNALKVGNKLYQVL